MRKGVLQAEGHITHPHRSASGLTRRILVGRCATHQTHTRRGHTEGLAAQTTRQPLHFIPCWRPSAWISPSAPGKGGVDRGGCLYSLAKCVMSQGYTTLSDTSTWQGCLCREAEHARFTMSVLWLNYPYGLLHLLLCCPRPHEVISSYSMFVYYSPQCDHVLDLVIASQNPLG